MYLLNAIFLFPSYMACTSLRVTICFPVCQNSYQFGNPVPDSVTPLGPSVAERATIADLATPVVDSTTVVETTTPRNIPEDHFETQGLAVGLQLVNAAPYNPTRDPGRSNHPALAACEVRYLNGGHHSFHGGYQERHRASHSVTEMPDRCLQNASAVTFR